MAHHIRKNILPFTAIVGQDQMKQALILNAINQRIGGVLIRGEKGTAKSTAVRALAEILPVIEIVKGCPFNCNPANVQELCDICNERIESGEKIETLKKKVQVITLPLGSTEDRVIGTIDIERAIKEGIKALEPGILAAVNRGILYIDEVNLLEDHVVDVLLDSAAMGVNVVEREGISLSHPAKFILIGTMNPEEGELRPQMLDRFGLQVTVEGIADVDDRVEIVRVADEFETNPAAFMQKYDAEQKRLTEKIITAKKILPKVKITDEIVRRIAQTCVDMGVMTHRAEITVVRTAKTIAAFNGREEVTVEDVREAMALSLPHRMRKKPFEDPRVDQQKINDMMQDEQKKNNSKPDVEQQQEQQSAQQPSPPSRDQQEPEKPEDSGTPSARPPLEQVFDIGRPIETSQIRYDTCRDRMKRLYVSGRRVDTISAENRGRYAKVRMPHELKDIAFDATLRVAAPHQKNRNHNSNSIVIHDQDIREKSRVGKVSVTCVFVVDISGSMGAEKRMESAKGAVLSLLKDAYRNRDRVSLVAFRGNEAEVVMPLSSSVDLAYKQLKEMPTGGKTPLARGLMKGYEVLMNEKKKRKEIIPLLILISDGRANTGYGKNVREEIMSIARQLKEEGIHTVIIDTESVRRSLVNFQLGYCREIAETANGTYYALSDLSVEGVSLISKHEADRLIASFM
jgi:magnesium chelatase subunit D